MNYFKDEYLKAASVEDIQAKVKCQDTAVLIHKLNRYPHANAVNAVLIDGEFGVTVDFCQDEELFNVVFVVDNERQKGILSWYTDISIGMELEPVNRTITPDQLISYFEATPHILNYSKEM